MLEFLKKTEKKGKSVSEATAAALAALGASEEDVVIEVIDEGAKGFLGIGAKEAVVSASLKNPEIMAAKHFLSEVFKAMHLEVEIDIEMQPQDAMLITISGESMGIVIGKRGDTLDSLQYLTSLIVNRETDKYIKVTLDAENYREKRCNSLIALSNRLAEKVAKTGRRHTLEPMNPYERRIIHSNLQGNENVITRSVGEEPYRKIIIEPKNARPYYKKPYRKYPGFDSYAEATEETEE